MQTVTGRILQAIRVEKTLEEKRRKIESIFDSMKKDKSLRDFFWEEYETLGERAQELIQENIPELFPEN